LTYDTNGHVVEVADQTGRKVCYAYDQSGNLTNHADPLGNMTRYEYDAPGRLTRVFKPADPLHPFLANEYADGYILHESDLQGEGEIGEFHVYAAQVLAQTNSTGNRCAVLYAAGRQSREVRPSGSARVWHFDEQGNTVRMTDPLGFETAAAYDGVGRLVRVTLPEGNGREYVRDLRDNVTEIRAFPKAGSTEPPLVSRIDYHPDFNRVTRFTDPLGRTTDFTYDARGNVERLELPDIGGVRPTYRFTVNGRGQIEDLRGPEGSRLTRTYDPATGETLSATSDPGGLAIATAFEYDAVGNVVRVTDARGNASRFEYDANRNVIRTETPAPFAHETRLGFNPDGDLDRIERETGEAQSPWQTTAMAFDPLAGTKRITDAEGGVISFWNNEDGALGKIIDAGGGVKQARYDARGLPFQLLGPNGNAMEEHASTPNGTKSSVRDANTNRTDFLDDALGRPVRETFADGSYQEYTYGANSLVARKQTRSGQQVTFSYDTQDRLVREVLPGPTAVDYHYDLLGRLTNVTWGAGTLRFAYDAVDRMTSATYPEGRTVRYQYDRIGNLTRLEYPDGYSVAYAYDSMNRLTQMRGPGDALLAEFVYDALSRRTRTTCGNGVVEEYGHDRLSRVRRIDYHFTDKSARFTYDYDTAGNLARFTTDDAAFAYSPGSAGQTIYGVNALNQCVSVNGVARAHDANGNLTSHAANTYAYDVKNRLVAATTPAHQIVYEYDPLGRRTRKTVDGTATSFLYSGLNLLAEYDASGTLVRRYLYEPGFDAPVMLHTATNQYYYHQDRLRSVVALSDAAGHAVETYAYSPYGEPGRTSALGNPLLFTGREFDADTGLYYYRNRFYAPDLGRFVSVDPIGYSGDGLNLYTYVSNNPQRGTDALGLSWWQSLTQPAGGYLDEAYAIATDMKNSQDPNEAAAGTELETVLKTLEEYGQMRAAKPEGGNCVVSWRDLRSSGFFDKFKDLNYIEVKEGAGGKYGSVQPGSYPHFFVDVTLKGSTDYKDSIVIFDPLLQIAGYQRDGTERNWDGGAFRDPKLYRSEVLAVTYQGTDVYLGKNPNLVNNPYGIGPYEEALITAYKKGTIGKIRGFAWDLRNTLSIIDDHRRR